FVSFSCIFSTAKDEDSDVDIPEDDGSDSDIDEGQHPRPQHPRHTQISGRGGARFIGSMRGGDSEEHLFNSVHFHSISFFLLHSLFKPKVKECARRKQKRKKSEDSEIDVDDDDEDGEEDNENEDLDEDNDSLEGSSNNPGRLKRSLHPQILEESDNDF
ncbi:hypothetical protein DNTS_026288, partial [Danionella cerebrum]